MKQKIFFITAPEGKVLIIPIFQFCIFFSVHTLSYQDKAKFLKETIFFLVHLFARDILLMKKFEIKETKTS